uniref:Uncharacterized protein LOC111129580 isoform X1 n=1 Tax=Crassostrea virginica TaxID=6565 RepID=A0A8B8DXN1_CRAVI|nr:uncharacterized protein LOC111129580 isoform X1 [Crassostrea virginica]XP_022331751.1 uncharacterized protein LOC111129580 isoform X1 [Crassostrea virginica]XP_022331759.1 uncharacterized protein LOC111129580 isoform X1 [Crassostrea virginica]
MEKVVEVGENLPEITFSKPSPRLDRKNKTPKVSTLQSDDVVEVGEDLPEITFSKPSPKLDRKNNTPKVSTLQSDDFHDEDFELPDLQNEHVPQTMSKSIPDLCASEESPCITENEVMDKEVENFFNVMEMKIKRREMADRAEIAFPTEGKDITIVYQHHGGMSFSRPFCLNDTMQSVFNFICQAVEPEILPPIFHLECPSPESCLSAHCRHKYELENAYGVNAAIIPSVLILKEGNYNMDDTITNYGNVFFKDI